MAKYSITLLRFLHLKYKSAFVFIGFINHFLPDNRRNELHSCIYWFYNSNPNNMRMMNKTTPIENILKLIFTIHLRIPKMIIKMIAIINSSNIIFSPLLYRTFNYNFFINIIIIYLFLYQVIL